MTDTARQFRERGWVAFPAEPDVVAWASAAQPLATGIAADPENRAAWLRCGGTWFVGVNILPNDPRGAVPEAGVPPLGGRVMRFVDEVLDLPGIALDRAQVSVCYPGYPQPWEGETEAALRYRIKRDAAHVDGLLRDDAKRRYIGETHAFILGLPLTETPMDAAPFVVWEGSHEVMRAAFRERLAGVPPDLWGREDVTDAYVTARNRVFETCPRIVLHARPGEAYLCHRLILHGVAPWPAGGADSMSDGTADGTGRRCVGRAGDCLFPPRSARRSAARLVGGTGLSLRAVHAGERGSRTLANRPFDCRAGPRATPSRRAAQRRG